MESIDKNIILEETSRSNMNTMKVSTSACRVMLFPTNICADYLLLSVHFLNINKSKIDIKVLAEK